MKASASEAAATDLGSLLAYMHCHGKPNTSAEACWNGVSVITVNFGGVASIVVPIVNAQNLLSGGAHPAQICYPARHDKKVTFPLVPCS
jgi:hypothetical protein